MPITQIGQVNTAALVVPGLTVQIVPPGALTLNGVPSNVIGMVGTATWGPVGQPVTVGTFAEYLANFGTIQNRKYDMATQVAVAIAQGASAFQCVRVTDGTDTAATVTVTISATAVLTYTGIETGTLGNSITVTHALGSLGTGYLKVTVTVPGSGITPEIFDNINVSTLATSWTNVMNAINQGIGTQPASKIVIASAPGTTQAATYTSYTLSGGTDGATSVTATTLVGVDGTARKGMYALRSMGCSIGVLADCDTMTTWSTILPFALSEGIYFVVNGPSGDTISTGITNLQAAGVVSSTSYGLKVMFGDWIWWYDPVNQITRLVSPAGFVAGQLGNLAPNQSTLNKQMYGIVATQKSGQSGTNNRYSQADLQQLISAGYDVIANPCPGGNYFGCQAGHSCTSRADIHSDQYARMINFIADTVLAGMGLYIGQPITPTLLENVTSTLSDFLLALVTQGLLSVDAQGNLPFSIVCNNTNNIQSRTALGYVQADVQVRFQGIDEFLIVNLQGGASVQISRQTLPQ